jgi:hypothetical protein
MMGAIHSSSRRRAAAPVSSGKPALAVRWPMPTMSNPTIIDLDTTGNQTQWSFSSGQDVIFLGPSVTPRTHGTSGPGAQVYCLQTSGGRHICVIGGKWMPQGGNDASTATIKITNYTGQAWIDGVHIDHINLGFRDSFAGQGSTTTEYVGDFIVQNSIVENVKGTHPGDHGDIWQGHGNCRNLAFHNFYGETNYQGLLFQNPTSSPRTIARVDLSNVWLHANPKRSDNTNTFIFLLYLGTTPVFPLTLEDVWVTSDPANGWSNQAGVDNLILNVSNFVFGEGGENTVGFNRSEWTGYINLYNSPSLNSIVDPATIGLGYSRGYRSGGGPIVVTPDPLAALSFNGTSQAVTYADGTIWDFPTTNWTLGFMMNFSSITGTSVRSIFSTGTLTTAGVVGFQLYSATHASEPGRVEFSLTAQAGGTTQYCSSNADVSSLLDGTWRLWTCEWVAATSTMNMYQTPINGTRSLVGTLSSVVYGATALNPATNTPHLMTRAPATASNGRWVNGNLAMFFKIHGLLDATETQSLAAGQHLITDLDRGPHILTYFDTATSPIANDGQGGTADATLVGSPTVVSGPTF